MTRRVFTMPTEHTLPHSANIIPHPTQSRVRTGKRGEKDDTGDKCKVIQPKTKIFVGRKIN